jgi:hypothetical protein
MRTAPDESMRRKLSGSSLGWRAAIAFALALVVATASARSGKADVSVSTVTPSFNHSTANITDSSTKTPPYAAINLLRSWLVPLAVRRPARERSGPESEAPARARGQPCRAKPLPTPTHWTVPKSAPKAARRLGSATVSTELSINAIEDANTQAARTTRRRDFAAQLARAAARRLLLRPRTER